MKIDGWTILVVMCCCSCSSSSSSVAAFFTGLIPRTGPHFLKVSRWNDVIGKRSFLLDLIKRIEPFKTEKEKKVEIDKIRESNPNEAETFCAAAEKVGKYRTTPPYDQPGDILTIGGMKKPLAVALERIQPGIKRDDIEIPTRILCGM